MRKVLLYLNILIFVSTTACIKKPAYQLPEITKEAKPWTYWWWMGSSVTKEGITEELEGFSKAGIGGVHIIPIYGVKGDEENEIPYLSDRWIEMLQHTLDKAAELGMGVDMTTGTGWPFGGPDLENVDKSQRTDYRSYKLKGDVTHYLRLKHKDKSFKVVALLAVKDEYTKVDLLERYKNSVWSFFWTPPRGDWTLHVLYQGITGEHVKRAAPGAEGHAIDYFNKNALKNYLVRFDTSLSKLQGENHLRSVYNDSYELFMANWTSDFFYEFKKRRGYDFKEYFYVRYDSIDNIMHQRVLQDYHETLSDLVTEEFTYNWVNWANKNGYESRNQAHGSPGNILDMYAASSIPETESFGSSNFHIPYLRVDPDYEVERFNKPNQLVMKFASSPSNILSKKYTSAESTTWLANHFKVSLSQIKPQIDELFVSGINHIFFHGSTYSPSSFKWPGRLFYASTNYNHNSHFWNDLPELTGYIARCQNILQNTQSDNDILVYFPIYDLWTNNGEQPAMIHMIGVHTTNKWLENTSMGNIAHLLLDQGYTFDFISDRQIKKLKTDELNQVYINKSKYKTIIIPKTKYMPISTINALKSLSMKGVEVIFVDQLPASVPGWNNRKERQKQLEAIHTEFEEMNINAVKFSQIEKVLHEKGIVNEKLTEVGLSFIRKKYPEGKIYFVSNLNNKFYEGWVQLSKLYRSVEIYDPLTQKRGLAKINTLNEKTTILLQLDPGQSCFLFASEDRTRSDKWKYMEIHNSPIDLSTKWSIEFLEGKPKLPAPIETNKLKSWTKMGDENTEYFSGTALYKKEFSVSESQLKNAFLLDLGDVREVADVQINGYEIGKSWCLPYKLLIPQGIIRTKNTIKIKVTNLSANRIKYMDEKGIEWKNFKDINFVDIKYKPFDASNWESVESGLLGPIKLVPVKLEKK